MPSGFYPSEHVSSPCLTSWHWRLLRPTRALPPLWCPRRATSSKVASRTACTGTWECTCQPWRNTCPSWTPCTRSTTWSRMKLCEGPRWSDQVGTRSAPLKGGSGAEKSRTSCSTREVGAAGVLTLGGVLDALRRTILSVVTSSMVPSGDDKEVEGSMMKKDKTQQESSHCFFDFRRTFFFAVCVA